MEQATTTASSSPRSERPAVAAARRWAADHRFGLAAGCAAAAVALLHLAGLASAPPGLYHDEASFGYDAWAVAHHGRDQWGHTLPLFFQSFDDWKSPLYVYLLAPLTWVLPLDPSTIRLPAALCSLAVGALAALAVWRLTGSRSAGLLTLAGAGLMPWLVIQGRVAFDVATLTLSLTASMWCLAEAHIRRSSRWAVAAGVALGLAVFSYQSGRLLVALLAGAIALTLPERRRLVLAGPAVAYAILLVWSLHHPGALLARFHQVSVLGDDPAPLAAAGRLVTGYLSYLAPPFLALTGDTNPQHGTAVGGVLLLAQLPPLATGVALCARRRAEPLARLALLGLLAGPVPAALTREGSPHAVRAAGMIPFVLLLCGFGWTLLLPWLARRRVWAASLAGLAVLQAGLYVADLFLVYPSRAEQSFQVGQREAIVRARRLAGPHEVLLSTSLGEPYVQALVALRPPPGGSRAATVERTGTRQLEPGDLLATARPGDVAVLSPGDVPPPRAARLFEIAVPAPLWLGTEPAVVVYRAE